MGIPYSKQIHSAFDQVTPLVACGFRVLEKIRDISILVALIQLLTCFFLSLILLTLLGLLITVNPDLELERQAIVTPTVKWIASWVSDRDERRWIEVMLFVVLGGVGLGASAGYYTMQEHVLPANGNRVTEEVADEVVEGAVAQGGSS